MIMDINILDGVYYFYLKYKDFQWILDLKTVCRCQVRWRIEAIVQSLD